jgi:RNA polymerase sigma factor for flagellar operon FliA
VQTGPPPLDDLYAAHQDTVERAIASICRRHRLSPTDGEEFAAGVRLYLIDDDYAPLRRFQGRSSLYTYLLAVVAHRFRDWRNAHWGKWRSSAEAKRQGPVAVLLERLLVRDGLSFDEAVETLRTNYQVPETPAELADRAARFPVRPPRRYITDDELEESPALDTRSDAAVRNEEASRAARQARALLVSALHQLSAQDRIVLAMRFEDDLSIADIARAMHLNQKELYRRMARLLRRLRETLERRGLTREAAADVLHEGGFDRLTETAGEGKTAADVHLFDGDRTPWPPAGGLSER